MSKVRRYRSSRKYRCPYCDKTATRDKLGRHVEDVHSAELPEGYTGARAVYDYLNKKNYGTCLICKTKVYEWDDRTSRYKNICSNPKCMAALKERAGHNHLENPEVQKKLLEGRKISGTYKFHDGITHSYVGSYERNCFEFMDTVMNIEGKDIMSPGPVIMYEYEGETHPWILDWMYIPAMLCCDVKDGGSNPNNRPMEDYRAKQLAKEEAIEKLGTYNYIRLTDNNFGQLLSAFAELRMGEIVKDPDKHMFINEATIQEGIFFRKKKDDNIEELKVAAEKILEPHKEEIVKFIDAYLAKNSKYKKAYTIEIEKPYVSEGKVIFNTYEYDLSDIYEDIIDKCDDKGIEFSNTKEAKAFYDFDTNLIKKLDEYVKAFGFHSWGEYQGDGDHGYAVIEIDISSVAESAIFNEAAFTVFKDDRKETKKVSLSDFKKVRIDNEILKKYPDIAQSINNNQIKDTDVGYIWVTKSGKWVAKLYIDNHDYGDGKKWLALIEIANDYRGLGLGEQVLDYAIHQEGCSALGVHKNNKVAIEMYKKAGFKISPASQKNVDSGKDNYYHMYLGKIEEYDYDVNKESSMNETVGGMPSNRAHCDYIVPRMMSGLDFEDRSHLYFGNTGSDKILKFDAEGNPIFIDKKDVDAEIEVSPKVVLGTDTAYYFNEEELRALGEDGLIEKLTGREYHGLAELLMEKVVDISDTIDSDFLGVLVSNGMVKNLQQVVLDNYIIKEEMIESKDNVIIYKDDDGYYMTTPGNVFVSPHYQSYTDISQDDIDLINNMYLEYIKRGGVN